MLKDTSHESHVKALHRSRVIFNHHWHLLAVRFEGFTFRALARGHSHRTGEFSFLLPHHDLPLD